MKVKDVLAKIDDGPLILELTVRGHIVIEFNKDGGLKKGELGKVLEFLRDEGYLAVTEYADIGTGFELYRNRKTEEFRSWLRELFWQNLGRIV